MIQKIILFVLFIALACVLVVQTPTIITLVSNIDSGNVYVPPVRGESYTPPARLIEGMQEGETFFDAMDRTYRLSLDTRFLNAIGRIHSLLTQESPGQATATFVDEAWQVTYGDEVVGRIKSLPDFDDWSPLLRAWAQKVEATHPLDLAVQGSGSIFDDGFLSPYALAGLKEANARWDAGTFTQSDLFRSVRYLVDLNVQSMDVLSVGDNLPAQALALLYIAQAKEPEALLKEECLLAQHLGYARWASRVAESWSPDDPLRAFLLHDDARLYALAKTANADERTRYLYALRLVEGVKTTQDWESLSTWLDRYYPKRRWELSVLNLMMDGAYFNIHRQLSPALPYAIHETLKQDIAGKYANVDVQNIRLFKSELGRLETSITQSLEDSRNGQESVFVALLPGLKTQYSGALLPTEVARSYYEGAYYSSQYWQGTFLLDSLSAVGRAGEYAQVLQDNQSEVGQELSQWYGHLVQSKQQQPMFNALMNDIKDFNYLGSTALKRTMQETKSWIQSWTDIKNIQAAKSCFSKMDSRPSHLSFAANLLKIRVYDLKRGMEYSQRSFDINSIEEHSIVIAYSNADIDTLALLLKDTSIRLHYRRWVLSNFLELSEKLNEGTFSPEHLELVQQVYVEMLAETPELWQLHEDYSDFCASQGDFFTAEQTVQEWIDGNYFYEGLEGVAAVNQLTYLLIEQKKYEEAWEMIKPNVRSMQGTALARATTTLRLLGREEESIEMGKRSIARYPNNLSSAHHLAKVYWEFGRYNEAADIYTSPNYNISNNDWFHRVGSAFTFIFKNKSKEEAIEAFDVFLNKGVSPKALILLAKKMNEAELYEASFEMSERLRGGGWTELDYRLTGYESQVALVGEEKALAWLSERVNPVWKDMNTWFLYKQGEWDLMWELGSKNAVGSSASTIWMFRAAAYINPENKEKKHRDELLAYYANPPQAYQDIIGRYLMDLEDKTTVIQLIDSQGKMSECGYFLGLKAQAMGDYETASDWYRVASESESVNDLETRLATKQLLAWSYGGSLVGAKRLGM